MIFSWKSLPGSLRRSSAWGGVASENEDKNFESSRALGKGTKESIGSSDPIKKLIRKFLNIF